jgi:hypothetical protein
MGCHAGGCDGRDQETLAEDHVDLSHLEVIAVPEREEDDVDAVVPGHDLGALVAFDDVLGDEVVELEDVSQLRQSVGRGVCHIDPDPGTRILERGSEVGERVDDPQRARCPDASH